MGDSRLEYCDTTLLLSDLRAPGAHARWPLYRMLG